MDKALITRHPEVPENVGSDNQANKVDNMGTQISKIEFLIFFFFFSAFPGEKFYSINNARMTQYVDNEVTYTETLEATVAHLEPIQDTTLKYASKSDCAPMLVPGPKYPYWRTIETGNGASECLYKGYMGGWRPTGKDIYAWTKGVAILVSVNNYGSFNTTVCAGGITGFKPSQVHRKATIGYMRHGKMVNMGRSDYESSDFYDEEIEGAKEPVDVALMCASKGYAGEDLANAILRGETKEVVVTMGKTVFRYPVNKDVLADAKVISRLFKGVTREGSGAYWIRINPDSSDDGEDEYAGDR
jgi:hypothetical protein